MTSSSFPIHLTLQNGKTVQVENWIAFDGSFKRVEGCKDVYPLGYGLGLFHDERDRIECILSFSNYDLIRWLDSRYVKIYSGASYLKMIRSLSRHRRILSTFYPPNPLESIGGLLVQGYPVFYGLDHGNIKLHVYSNRDGKVYTSLDEVDGRIIVDIHFDRPKPIKNINPSLLIARVTKSEAEYILKLREEIKNPFSVIEGRASYFLVSLVYDRVEYSSLKEVLYRILSRNRLKTVRLSSLSIDDIPIVKHVGGDYYLGEYGGEGLDGILFVHHPSNISLGVDGSQLSRLIRRSRYYG